MLCVFACRISYVCASLLKYVCKPWPHLQVRAPVGPTETEGLILRSAAKPRASKPAVYYTHPSSGWEVRTFGPAANALPQPSPSDQNFPPQRGPAQLPPTQTLP